MRRRIVRPFGSSIPASRGFSMLVGLAILWVLYDAMSQPASWQWLSANDDHVSLGAVAVAADQPQEPFQETIVPGPNDLDPEVVADFQSREELITDRAALRPREMIAYWQLLGWSRTQAFAEFEKRSLQEPALTQIWEEPKKYRGKPIRLRMHVRRVLKFDAAKNPLGATEVYEAMGWTDESKSLPYTVVFLEAPPELPIGKDVEAEVVFVGYFLKIMTYTAFDDTRRGTPLLMGRIRMANQLAKKPAALANPWEIGGLVLGGVLLSAVGYWFISKQPRSRLGTVQSKLTVPSDWVPFEDTAPAVTPELATVAAGSSNAVAMDEQTPQPSRKPADE